MTYKQSAFQTAAEGLIKNLEKRGMEGYFFENSSACTEAVMNLFSDGNIISWGGSESIKEIGLMDRIHHNGSYTLIDRNAAVTQDERRLLYAQAVMADYYLMGTNAITLNGELINIDGQGNRVACLIYGPEHVIVVAGMNKVVTDMQSGINRVRNFASPANAKRLDRQTPCNFTGQCGDCLAADCMCNQIVITRRSGIKGRIKVFLVAEDLGF